jgi:Amt family ammonium transporter
MNESAADHLFSEKRAECLSREPSTCQGSSYADHYDDASANWVILCAILLFFMRAGFLYVEMAFSITHKRRRVVLTKYCDLFAGTLGFWLIGFAFSGSTDAHVLGSEEDFIFWFFRFMFATNAATIIGGTLVGQEVEMRTFATFIYGFTMTAVIHPGVANVFWSLHQYNSDTPVLSPYHSCNVSAVKDSGLVIRTGRDPIYFFDLAGCGVVHVCGGTAAFVLSLFHKLEVSKKAKRFQNLPLLRRKDVSLKNENVQGVEAVSRCIDSPIQGTWLRI